MKKILLCIFLLTASLIWGQPRNVIVPEDAIQKSTDLLNSYLPMATGDNTLGNSPIYYNQNEGAVTIPVSLLINSLASYNGSWLSIEGVEFSNFSMRAPGYIYTFGGASGLEWMELSGDSGYVYWSAMHNAGASDGQVMAWDSAGSYWKPVANTGGSTDTTYLDERITTLEGNVDQDVTSGSSPTLNADNFSDGGSNAIITTTQETNFETAYSHSQDNTQAHSDYLLNNADDETTGILTMGGYKINTHNIVGDTTLTASMMYGGKFYIEANATVTLPAVADGMSGSFKVMGAYTAHIDPNASDKIFLDDTALDDGDKASSGGTSGELIVIEYWSADGWDANSDGWSDGG
jgi:hypothetical protein